jgi:predicted lactoylglutathione lyase
MHEVENIIPVFPVKDAEASKIFYIKKLGFAVDWDAGSICSVSRDGHCLMLSQKAEVASPAMAWIGLETDSLMKMAIDTELEIHQEARNDDFAYHMKIKDIDGNILWFGTETKRSEQDRGANALPRAAHD